MSFIEKNKIKRQKNLFQTKGQKKKVMKRTTNEIKINNLPDKKLRQ